MGREVRKVTADWQHPKASDGRYIPLMEYVSKEIHEGFYDAADQENPYNESDYMPDFRDTGTHFMLYENVSEGTPMSPAFATREELARWLTDNNIPPSWTGSTATYEQWLAMINQGSCVSMMASNGVLYNGVEASQLLK